MLLQDKIPALISMMCLPMLHVRSPTLPCPPLTNIRGSLGWFAEVRQMSTVFLHLSSTPTGLSDEQFATHLQETGNAIHEVTNRYDGTIHDYREDDKGLVAIVLFGARRTHEDDAERAARCAVDLVDTLAESGIRATAGVTWSCTCLGLGYLTGSRLTASLRVGKISSRFLDCSKTPQ